MQARLAVRQAGPATIRIHGACTLLSKNNVYPIQFPIQLVGFSVAGSCMSGTKLPPERPQEREEKIGRMELAEVTASARRCRKSPDRLEKPGNAGSGSVFARAGGRAGANSNELN